VGGVAGHDEQLRAGVDQALAAIDHRGQRRHALAAKGGAAVRHLRDRAHEQGHVVLVAQGGRGAEHLAHEVDRCRRPHSAQHADNAAACGPFRQGLHLTFSLGLRSGGRLV
jgi:hypothetical protein